jgi:hypothetical protein
MSHTAKNYPFPLAQGLRASLKFDLMLQVWNQIRNYSMNLTRERALFVTWATEWHNEPTKRALTSSSSLPKVTIATNCFVHSQYRAQLQFHSDGIILHQHHLIPKRTCMCWYEIRKKKAEWKLCICTKCNHSLESSFLLTLL